MGTRPFQLQLDNDEVDRLLSAMNGADLMEDEGGESAVHVRLRYLQKIGFPATAKAGRGKRALHGTESVLQLAFAFDLLALGITAKKAAATVVDNWPSLRPAFARSWLAFKRSRWVGPDGADARDHEVSTSRCLFRLTPHHVAEMPDAEALDARTTTYADLHFLYTGSVTAASAQILVDPFSMLWHLYKALTEKLRLRDEDVESALNEFFEG